MQFRGLTREALVAPRGGACERVAGGVGGDGQRARAGAPRGLGAHARVDTTRDGGLSIAAVAVAWIARGIADFAIALARHRLQDCPSHPCRGSDPLGLRVRHDRGVGGRGEAHRYREGTGAGLHGSTSMFVMMSTVPCPRFSGPLSFTL